MAREAQRTGVAHVGNTKQLTFNPFDNPVRAKLEEFGDLIAEGLYALFTDVGGLHLATVEYWKRFIDERRALIVKIRRGLVKEETHESAQAAKSLQEALSQLEMVTPEDCAHFLELWQEDRWRFTSWTGAAHGHEYGYHAAFAALGLKRWQEARFGMSRIPVEASQLRSSTPTHPSSTSLRPESSIS